MQPEGRILLAQPSSAARITILVLHPEVRPILNVITEIADSTFQSEWDCKILSSGMSQSYIEDWPCFLGKYKNVKSCQLSRTEIRWWIKQRYVKRQWLATKKQKNTILQFNAMVYHA